MTKRARFDFSSGDPVFRISKAGVEVEMASDDELLMDERGLYAQVVQTGVLVRTVFGASVDMTFSIVDLGYKPYLIIWPINDDDAIVRPGIMKRYGSSNQIFYLLRQTSNTSVTVRFSSTSIAKGLYYQVLRLKRL